MYYSIEDEETSTYPKPAKKKTVKKSNHKHDYELCLVKAKSKESYPSRMIVKRCKICGKISFDVKSSTIKKLFPQYNSKNLTFIGNFIVRDPEIAGEVEEYFKEKGSLYEIDEINYDLKYI